jgi:hypothetical protein
MSAKTRRPSKPNPADVEKALRMALKLIDDLDLRRTVEDDDQGQIPTTYKALRQALRSLGRTGEAKSVDLVQVARSVVKDWKRKNFNTCGDCGPYHSEQVGAESVLTAMLAARSGKRGKR